MSCDTNNPIQFSNEARHLLNRHSDDKQREAGLSTMMAAFQPIKLAKSTRNNDSDARNIYFSMERLLS